MGHKNLIYLLSKSCSNNFKLSRHKIETNQTRFNGHVVGFNFNLEYRIRFTCTKLKEKEREKTRCYILREREREEVKLLTQLTC